MMIVFKVGTFIVFFRDVLSRGSVVMVLTTCQAIDIIIYVTRGNGDTFGK